MSCEGLEARTLKRNTLLFFVKFPEPGKVKTRLARVIGSENAAATYRRLVETNLAILKPLIGEISVVITFNPSEKELWMKNWLSRDFLYSPQQGSGLGERLQNAFAGVFERGCQKVIALGTDTLGLCPTLIQEAFASLDQSEVVLGPAKDGGYYLIGLKKLVPELFHDIPWSTSRVFEITRYRVELMNLSYHLSPELEDILKLTGF